MKNKQEILITRLIPESAIKLLRRYFKLTVFAKNRPITKNELRNLIADKVGLISLLTDNIDRNIMGSAPNLKVIANYAAGYNNIDLREATKRHIMVTNTPDVLTETTADLTFGMILAIARRIPEAQEFLRRHKFSGWSPMLLVGTDVHHKTLGIIGMGRIGKAVARRAAGFGMKVYYYDIVRLSRTEEKKLNTTYKPLRTILRESDFVSIHTPLNNKTFHLISTKEFLLMKKSAFIINAARGPIIDENALVTALKSKKIAGCSLDVFEYEPRIPAQLLKMENVLLLPHIGSATIETRTKMALMAAKNLIIALIEKRTPPNLVNPEVSNAIK